VTDDQRCQARSTLTGAQCVLAAGHVGRHSATQLTDAAFGDEGGLWTEPDPENPVTLGHFLDEMRDLEAHARDEGFVHLADRLRTLRAIITLDWHSFDRPAPASPAATPRT